MPRLSLSDAFSEALLHDEHVVLGRPLHPFCLDDWLLLDALKSPLIHGGPVTIVDLQLAVLVCSTGNMAEFKRASLRPDWRMKLWRFLSLRRDPAQVLAEFTAYLDDHFVQFRRWQSHESGAMKCPPLVVCCARLVSDGQPIREVRRMGLGDVMAWITAIPEALGHDDKTLMTDEEAEWADEVNATAAEESAP